MIFASSWLTQVFLMRCLWQDVNIRSILFTGISSNATVGNARVKTLNNVEAYIFSLICSSVEMYNLHTACKNMLESFRLTMDDDNSSVYYGKRLIFLKESIFLRLESARRRYHAECVRKIESFWLKHSKYLFACKIHIFFMLIVNFRT